MAKSPLDDQIDQLYQLPLDEFTAARNALAKQSGDNAVKKLDKPAAAVWAINQIYWCERKLYDEVLKTSGQVQTAHQQLLAGKRADVRAAEVFHTEALRKARHAIRGFLEQAGNKAADAVMTQVNETLDALPGGERPGRLTRPLRRTGFEALQGVTIVARPKAEPKPEPSKPAARETEKDKKKREAELQEQLMAKERLRFAEAAEREAAASVDRAKRTLERAERTRERVEQELDEAVAAEKTARKELASSESGVAKARAERDRLAQKARY